MKQEILIAQDDSGHKIVVLPDIIFKNKRNIDWYAVEKYLHKYVGEIVTIAETQDVVHIGIDFPDEYRGSNYTRHLKGGNAKAKANAVQGIIEMLNFAIPIYEDDVKSDNYNVYSACLLINRTKFGKMYLYDLVDIKREASTPLKTIK